MMITISKSKLFEAIKDMKENSNDFDCKSYPNVDVDSVIACEIENLSLDEKTKEKTYNIIFILPNNYSFEFTIFESDSEEDIYTKLCDAIRNEGKKLQELFSTFSTMSILNIPL